MLAALGRVTCVSSSSARLSSRTLTPGSPKKPSQRPSVLLVDQLLRRAPAERPRSLATRAACSCAFAGRDVRVDARGGGGDRVDGDVADREPGVVRALELEDRPALLATAFARSGFVGPRFAKRRRRRRCRPARRRGARVEVLRLVNACAASCEPTTLPSRSTRLPLALSANASCAKPVIDERVDEPEDDRQHDDGDDGARRACASWRERLHDRPERERREDHQPGGQDDDADEQDDEGRAVGAERAGRRRARSSSPRARRRARAPR